MKQMHGTAAGVVAAPIEACFALLDALERYPTWYPDVVRELEVVERNDEGRATKAQTSLHASYGPVARDFRLLLAVNAVPPRTVTLTRIPHGPSDRERFDVSWRLQADGAGTRIELELDANLSVPRLVPLGGIGEAMAQGFVAAATRALGSAA